MKVIHLSCVRPPQIGGIGRVASTEVELLKARGIDASLVTVPALWSYGNTAAPFPFALDRALRGADIVHLHYPFYGTSEFVVLLKWLKRVKHLVLTLHMDATHQGIKGTILDFHRAVFQPFELNAADALLVSSKDYAAHSSFAPWKDKVIELPFGVDEKRFSPIGKPHGKTVVFVGGMDRPHAFKGVDVLLRAFAELPQDARLVLVGDGELRSGYEKLAKELGIGERVTFLGRVSDAELPDVYRSADMLAFPSVTGAEAFGLVALEAQACGIPVVASDLPGVRTVVDDKVTGFLSPAGDAKELAAHLRLILENPGMAEEFGRAARERVLKSFTWDRHIDGLVEVYQNVCASRS